MIPQADPLWWLFVVSSFLVVTGIAGWLADRITGRNKR